MEKILAIDALTIYPIENDYVEISVYEEYTCLSKTDIQEIIEFLQKQLEK